MRPARRRPAERVRAAAARTGAAGVVGDRVPQPEVAASALDAAVPDRRPAQVGGARRRDAVQGEHPRGRSGAVDLEGGRDPRRLGVRAVVRRDHAHRVVALGREARPGEGVRPADVVGRHRRVEHELGRAAERGAVPVVARALPDRDRDACDARPAVGRRPAEAVRPAAGVPRSVVVVPAGSGERQNRGVRGGRVRCDRDRLADVPLGGAGRDDCRSRGCEPVVDAGRDQARRIVHRDAARAACACGAGRREGVISSRAPRRRCAASSLRPQEA